MSRGSLPCSNGVHAVAVAEAPLKRAPRHQRAERVSGVTILAVQEKAELRLIIWKLYRGVTPKLINV